MKTNKQLACWPLFGHGLRWVRYLVWGAAALMSLGGLAQAQQAYTVGVVPQFEPRRLLATWSPILEDLQRRTGLKFVYKGSTNIPEFEAAFAKGEFDFAYMNPYHALLAHEQQGYEPIVRDGGSKLYGVLVVARNSPVTKVSDLQGKKIAFPAPNALGASLLMRADLDREKGIKFEPIWAQTHASAYLLAALGRADAAGGVMGTLKQQPQDVQDQLRVVYETERMPTHPIVAHPRVDEKVRLRVQQALLDMGANVAGQALLAGIPIKQPKGAAFEDYRGLAKLRLGDYYVAGDDN